MQSHLLGQKDWAKMHELYRSIPPSDAPAENPLDKLIEAFATNRLRAFVRPRGEGAERQIPEEFWRRRPMEARLALATCAVDSSKLFEGGMLHDGDLFVAESDFEGFIVGLDAGARTRKATPISDDIIMGELAARRDKYLRGDLTKDTLAGEVNSSLNLRDKKRVLELTDRFTWIRGKGRPSKLGDR